MKVKVGSTIYDSEKQFIMAILSDADKKNIKNMNIERRKYCSYPKGSNWHEVKAWVDAKCKKDTKQIEVDYIMKERMRVKVNGVEGRINGIWIDVAGLKYNVEWVTEDKNIHTMWFVASEIESLESK